jgi:rubrerythrin
MSEYKDLEDMIDVLTLAIGREESEEQFFRRSAEASDHQAARAMFSEIAEELTNHRKNLESRRERLLEALKDLRMGKN